MATYTSTQNGPWNDPATWGGGGFPQVTGDVFNIGHLVTLNVNFDPAAVAFGQGNINNGGILAFARDLNTSLPFGHQDLVINNGGWLKVGESGLILPKTSLASLSWNTTADNAKGINLAAGGKLSIYGDPDYFGSDYDTTLVSQVVIPAAANAVTLTVTGDFTGKWLAGQELLVHKGGAYASYINDFCRLAITSLAANGPNTDLSCTVTERPAALTCLAGADVVNVSRNVLLHKLGYNANLGQYNTLRPRLANATASSSSVINVNNASFAGWNTCLQGNYGISSGGGIVFRNSGTALYNSYEFSDINAICLSCSTSVSLCSFMTIRGKIACGSYGVNGGFNNNIYADIFGMGYVAVGGTYHKVFGSVFANGAGFGTANEVKVYGNIGYNSALNSAANSVEVAFAYSGNSNVNSINAKTPNPPLFSGRNVVGYRGRAKFEHYLQITNAHYIADVFGDIYKVSADGSGDNPTRRPGGGTDVQEVVPLSNCAASACLELFNVRLWATANVSKTYRFYLQTDFTALAKNSLVLYGEYLDQAAGGRLGMVNSSTTGNFTTRTNAGDWSQYVEVTVNPAQDGYLSLYLRLMGYEAGKKVWIDPQPEGGAFTPRWSWGEVGLEPAGNAGPGANPSNIGLSPIGVKQVAI